jgi:farnesyl-diphosphate farnesyltransferase
MAQVFIDSLTKPSEIKALFQYKFAGKSPSAQRLHQTLAKDALKKRCYGFLNLVKKKTMLQICVVFSC